MVAPYRPPAEELPSPVTEAVREEAMAGALCIGYSVLCCSSVFIRAVGISDVPWVWALAPLWVPTAILAALPPLCVVVGVAHWLLDKCLAKRR